MDALLSFLSMGGYGAYVWPSYGLALIVMAGLYVLSRHELQRHERQLQALRDRERDENTRESA
ncbi:heme exporter protein CcmD [Fodinicurvata halophila]|uniref:Heme exporter protein D n=1 Tax=Fodinicurvata halophila TaxID=1419723 RepID=A0ABV8UKW4_9PROT